MLDYCQSSCWSVIKRVFFGEKGIFPVAVFSTFSAIAELFKGAAEFSLPADTRGRALLKFLVLGAMVFFVGYFITFLGDWISI